MSDRPETTLIDADLNLARRVAKVLGEHSAAAKAIADYERRMVAGESPVLFRDGNSWIVAAGAQLYPERQ